jgi:hypothetical protein
MLQDTLAKLERAINSRLSTVVGYKQECLAEASSTVQHLRQLLGSSEEPRPPIHSQIVHVLLLLDEAGVLDKL